MTKAQNWMITALAVVALAAGVLLVTGAVSFAQTDEPTPTPSATEDAGDGATPTPSDDTEDDDSSGEDASPEEDANEDESEGRGCGGGGKYLIKEAAAEVLGISEEDLIAGLRDGQSLAQIAEAQGMSVDDFRAALLENVTADLQDKLDAGDITQEQFDEKVSELNANIDEIINTEGGLRFHGRGDESGEDGSETGGVRFRRGAVPSFEA
jgi:phage-related tail protein